MCATDERSHQLENAQLVGGEGPCTEAYERRRPVEADLRQNRWPIFTRTAAELGIRGVTALPLLVGDVVVGALDLYRTSPGPLSPPDRARLDAYAHILALLTMDGHLVLVSGGEAERTSGPHGFPPVVHMAAGALSVHHDVTIEEALARLRAHAFSSDQRLTDVAQDVLDGQLRLERDSH